jgi:hypothetical protein
MHFQNPVQNEELFNLRHSSMCVTVERVFGSLKRRFKVLDDVKSFFPIETQVDTVVAYCIIYNWVIEDELDELIISDASWVPNQNYASSSSGQATEHIFMVNFKQDIANQMWVDRQNHGNSVF